MRTMSCPCGLVLTGAVDEVLLRLGWAHADSHHADDHITEELIGQHVAAVARAAG